MPFTEFYCNAATGSNLNSGSTPDAAAVYSATNGGWNSATGVFTPTSSDPSATVSVGMFASVHIDGATVGVFVGRVTAVSSTTITISTSIKMGTAPTTLATGRSIKVGGAWKGPNAASGFPFTIAGGAAVNASGDGTRINLIGGTTYSITASIVALSTTGYTVQGYAVTPGDGGRATIDGGVSGASYVLLNMTGGSLIDSVVADLVLQNNGATGSEDGLALAGRVLTIRCVVNNVRGNGFRVGSLGTFQECEAYACNQSNTDSFGGFTANGSSGCFIRCISHDNAGSNSHGFVGASQSIHLIECIAESNGGSGLLISTALSLAFVNGCDFYNNGADGISQTATVYTDHCIENCSFVKNTGWGINGTGSGGRAGFAFNNGFGSGTQANGSGTTTGLKGVVEVDSVTYPADTTPYNDPANGDFRLVSPLANGTGRSAFTQIQAGYSGTACMPNIGAAGFKGTGQARTAVGNRTIGTRTAVGNRTAAAGRMLAAP